MGKKNKITDGIVQERMKETWRMGRDCVKGNLFRGNFGNKNLLYTSLDGCVNKTRSKFKTFRVSWHAIIRLKTLPGKDFRGWIEAYISNCKQHFYFLSSLLYSFLLETNGVEGLSLSLSKTPKTPSFLCLSVTSSFSFCIFRLFSSIQRCVFRLCLFINVFWWFFYDFNI